jgi:hypothetical protein
MPGRHCFERLPRCSLAQKALYLMQSNKHKETSSMNQQKRQIILTGLIFIIMLAVGYFLGSLVF